ncbi:MAG: DUF4253 domain-containing protein [Novosphingobium sp.]|uniref:hypothetical protein n=1 Tax=Novosphingobium sp. TaxID=1874826 RepID=UPI0032B91487
MALFGLGGSKPLTLTPFAEERPRTFMAILCDGFVARNVSSLKGLVTELRTLQAAHPAQRVLATLDDLEQACYTCGHTTLSNQLDEIEGHDLAGLDPEAFEAGEHRGYLSTPSEFPIRLANLLARAQGLSLGDLTGLLFWSEPGMANDPVTINRQAEKALDLALERAVLIQLVPVGSAAEALAALPNGYFTSDLNPMQNYALAAHLHEKFGLELFGIGSRFLGFWRNQPLSEDLAKELAQDLVPIYGEAPADAAESLAQVLRGKDVVLVRYTET